MPFASALSTTGNTEQAIREACVMAKEKMTATPDLAVLFYSAHHAGEADLLGRVIHETLTPRALLGCPGEAIVGDDREIERGPALSLWLAKWLQPVQIEPFHLTVEETSEGYSLLGWPDGLAAADPGRDVVLLLGDPFTFPPDSFLTQVNEQHAGLRVMGGMASGGREPGLNPMLSGTAIVEHGAVGVVLQGPIQLRTVVSQGCRPIGQPLVITKARDNLITELGGKPPTVHLQEIWEKAPQADRELIQQGLHVGRVINEYQAGFQRGDFLVRNVMGMDRNTGAVAITDRVRVGQTVQFHVRDAETASEDLKSLLEHDQSAGRGAAGALLFTCNGRGTRLFGDPHHDARAIRTHAGAIPVAGFFAMGEIGPIGQRNFIHGFTASIALFGE